MKIKFYFIILFLLAILNGGFTFAQEGEKGLIVRSNQDGSSHTIDMTVKKNTIFYTTDQAIISSVLVKHDAFLNEETTQHIDLPKSLNAPIIVHTLKSLSKIKQHEFIVKKIKTKLLALPFQQLNLNGKSFVTAFLQTTQRSYQVINQPIIDYLNYTFFFDIVEQKNTFKNPLMASSHFYCFSSFSRPPPAV